MRRVWMALLTLGFLAQLAPGQPFPGQEPVAVNQLDYLTEYRLPGAARGPLGIAVDVRGLVWVTATRTRGLGALDPTRQTYTETPVPAGVTPFLLLAAADGTLWLTDYDSTLQPQQEGVWRFDPAGGAFHRLALSTRPAGPAFLFQDSTRRIWFSQFVSGKLGRVAGEQVTDLAVPLPESTSGSSPADSAGPGAAGHGSVAIAHRGPGPVGLAEDDQGALWVALSHVDRLARLDTSTDRFALFSLPPDFWGPTGVAVDGGGRVYVGSHAGSRIAALDARTGQGLAQYETLPPPPEPVGLVATQPVGLVAGAGGEIWFAEHQGNRIGRILPATATTVEYRLPGRQTEPQWLAGDAAGGIWYAGFGTSTIGRIDPTAPYVTVTPASPPPFIPAGASYQGFLRITTSADRRLQLVAGDPDPKARVQVAFEPAALQLHAGEERLVRYTMLMPANARPGDYALPLGVDAGDFLASTRVTYTAVRSRAWWPWLMLGLGPLGLVIFLAIFRRSRRQA